MAKFLIALLFVYSSRILAADTQSLEDFKRRPAPVSIYDVKKKMVLGPHQKVDSVDREFLAQASKELAQSNGKEIPPTVKKKLEEVLKKYGFEGAEDYKSAADFLLRMR